MGVGRGLGLALGFAAALAAAGGAIAQDASGAPLLTIDQERLFVESAFGKGLMAREATAAEALAAENARIEADLIAEEQELTDRRATLSAEEFAVLADAFDTKVVRIRAEQETKARELTRAREADRQAFFRAVVPVLGDLLVERQAVAIVEKSTLILSLSAIDVTNLAIARIDAALGPADGTGETDPPADPGTAPEPSPAPAP